MPNPVLAILALAFFGFPPQQSTPPAATPPLQVIPLEAARMVNPITPTPESQAKAKNRYAIDCAMCHGANGDGKGDPGIISDMSLTMMDFTNPGTLKNRTDGEMFYIIKNGQGKMPPEDRAKTDEIWNLVVYLRAFSKK
ncbi:MAG TPA: cytochrome c [Acidobacteriaceae bacterium]|nr:cytochrome c [Acidobacteriaceae bacterium]